MSGRISEDRSEFGVLFVPGFAEQHPGTAIASFAGAGSPASAAQPQVSGPASGEEIHSDGFRGACVFSTTR